MTNFIGKRNSSRIGPTQAINVTSSSAQAANTLGAQTRQIRALSNTFCHLSISDSSGTSATTADAPIAAGFPEYFIAQPGQHIASVLGSSSGGALIAPAGTIWITEVS